MMVSLLYGGYSPRSNLRVSMVVIYARKNAPVSPRQCVGTCAWMKGNTLDVLIHIWFSFWNIALLSGKSGEIAAALKSCFMEIFCKNSKETMIKWLIMNISCSRVEVIILRMELVT